MTRKHIVLPICSVPASTADKARLPLFPKRRHTLGIVGGHVQLWLHQTLDLEVALEAGA